MDLRLMALNIRQFCPDLSIPVIKQRINMRYKQILGYEDWEFLYDSTTVRLYGIHNSVDGETITVAQSGVTVAGTGTTFTLWSAADRLRVGDDEQPYLIDTINSDVELLLSTAYGLSSVTGSDYSIFRPIYSPGVGDVAEIVQIVHQRPLTETTLTWLNKIDPERVSTGAPTRYRVATKTQAHGIVSFEIWPIPDQDYVITIYYKKLIPSLVNDTDEPVFRPDLLEAGSLWDCFRLQFSITNNPAYMGMARDARSEYFDELRKFIHEDMRTGSTSTRVRDVMNRTSFFDDEFLLDHDTELIG
jgi:hypothetical protein